MGGIVRQRKGRQALKDEPCSILDALVLAATRVHPRCKAIDMVQNENELSSTNVGKAQQGVAPHVWFVWFV
jgi:hypothetical protein